MHLSTAMLSIFLQLVKKVFLLGANFLHILMMPELDLSLFSPPKLTLFFIPSFVLAVSLAGKCIEHFCNDGPRNHFTIVQFCCY